MKSDKVKTLRVARSRLKQEGRLDAAIPYQLQLVELAKTSGRIEDLSDAWNYLSGLYLQVGRHSDAEIAALEALENYHNEPNPNDERVACFELVIAQVLAAQKRFAEAVPFGKSAIEHYAVFHNPPDNFLLSVIRDVELMIELRDRESESAG